MTIDRRTLSIGIAAGLLAVVLWLAYPYLAPPRGPTLADLPPGAVYTPHPDEEKQALELGKLPMMHYATPEAIRRGGPIFGAVGYRIVSIEYEIPAEAIGERSVGLDFPGYLLALPELRGVPVDHFHVSRHPEHLAGADAHAHEGGVYSIHFMLIPHEEELRQGIVCE